MRKLVCLIGLVFTAVLLHPSHIVGQSFASLSGEVRRFVSVDSPVFALTNVRVVDGTGAAARPGQVNPVQTRQMDACRLHLGAI